MKYRAFEDWVEQLARDLGHTNVKRNVYHTRKLNGSSTRYEIDIEYGRLWWKRYVECKYSESRNIQLGKVAKFNSVLELLGVNSKKGIMVTNQGFTERAKYYGEQHGIQLIGRKELLRLDRKRESFLVRLNPFREEENLERRIERMV